MAARALAILLLLVLVSTWPTRASVSYDSAKKNQLHRDALFNSLKKSVQYSFEYVVMFVPPGSIPGINFHVPVTHVRYNSTIFFSFNDSNLEPQADAVVLDFAKTILKDKSYRSILVVGHTDSIGADDYNAALSRNRAITVAAVLRRAGISEEHLAIVPMGEAQPIATNATDAGRAKNRRVEFFISEMPAATVKAIEQIKFDPCHRNDHERAKGKPENCEEGISRVPVLLPSGGGTPTAMIDLTRASLPQVPLGPRKRLPDLELVRPSLKDLEPKRVEHAQ